MKRLIALVLLAYLGQHPPSLHAQDTAGTSLTLTPSLGLGAILDRGNLESGGAEALLEVELTRSRLRWSVFGAVRGIGVGCSHGCDFSGESLGVEVSYLLGRVGVGGGVGLLHRSGEWHLQPHGQLSIGYGIFRAQLRVEVPQGVDGVFVPILFGLQVPVG